MYGTSSIEKRCIARPGLCFPNQKRSTRSATPPRGARLSSQAIHRRAVDLADSFIHFSSADQVAETAAKHFAGQHDLVLVAVDADVIGPSLKWEPSPGGALFPHLYGTLPLAAVRWVKPLPLGPD
jgi:uncharacterized protein (DUF952 family)